MSVLFDPERQHRRSIRLRGYDYTQAGAYFVTIVIQDRALELPPFRGRFTAWDSSRALRWLGGSVWDISSSRS